MSKSNFKPRKGEAIFLYDNSKAKKSEAEILSIMKKEAKGKPFAYGIYNGKPSLL